MRPILSILLLAVFGAAQTTPVCVAHRFTPQDAAFSTLTDKPDFNELLTIFCKGLPEDARLELTITGDNLSALGTLQLPVKNMPAALSGWKVWTGTQLLRVDAAKPITGLVLKLVLMTPSGEVVPKLVP